MNPNLNDFLDKMNALEDKESDDFWTELLWCDLAFVLCVVLIIYYIAIFGKY